MPDIISARSFKTLGRKIHAAYKPIWKYSADLLAKVKSPDLAIELSGTDDKKSKEYKAALRNVQRYKKGDRKPNADTQKKIVKAAKKVLGNPPAKYPPGVITVTGKIGYSDTARKRSIDGAFGASAMAEFVALARNPEADELDAEDPAAGPTGFFFSMSNHAIEGMYLVSGKITFEETKE